MTKFDSFLVAVNGSISRTSHNSSSFPHDKRQLGVLAADIQKT